MRIRKHLLASLDHSLRRMSLDHVDIFYSHRFDADTPLEETMGALHTAVSLGRALYAGISSYSSERTRQAAAILRDLGVPLLAHQPSYSILNRWIEDDLLDAADEVGAGVIAFSPLAQGLLTDRYRDGVPADSRGARGGSLRREFLTEANLSSVEALRSIAGIRGQTLAQLALAWALRRPTVASVVIGASSVARRPDPSRRPVSICAPTIGPRRVTAPVFPRLRDQHRARGRYRSTACIFSNIVRAPSCSA